MTLQEVNSRLKTGIITEEQLHDLTPAYIMLDIHKDDFCKLIDVLGVAALTQRKSWYERLEKAELELAKKERYLKARRRLEEIEYEKEELEKIVQEYKPM